MSVADNLNQIKACKESIRQAIIDKGVDMTDVAFTGYAEKIGEISGGGASDDTEYIEFDKVIGHQVLWQVPNCIKLNFASYNIECAPIPESGGYEISGDGYLLTLAIYSFDNNSLSTGTYTANAGNNQLNEWEFNIGGDVDMGGWTENNGTYCEKYPEEFGTPTNITDGTIDVSVSGDNLVIKLKSSVINARFTGSLSDFPFEVVVYDPTDYLTVRKSLTSYSSDETNIPAGAFYGMTNITEVSLPNAFAIPQDVFNNCMNLTTVDLPKVMLFGQRVFYNCSSLQSIDFPLLTDTGGESFQGCSSLSSVNLPKCQTVAGNAFYNCSSLQSIDLPECVFVASDAFSQCSNLTTVNLPKCKTVESNAFTSTILSEINLPECTNIGQNAFQGIMNLGIANIPKCKEIGQYAFSGCGNLLAITATECENILDGAFMSTPTPTINLLKCGRIGAMAFAWCNNLTSVYAPNCGEIAGAAFQGCQALTELDLSNVYFCSIPDLSVFEMTPFMNGEGTIKVHSSSLAYYQGNYPWNELSERLVGAGDPDVVLLANDNGRIYGETTGLYDNYLGFLAIGNDAVISIDLPNASKVHIIQCYPNLQSINLGKLEMTHTGQFCDNYALTTVNLPECTTVNNETFIRCFNLTTVNLPKCTFVSDFAFGECTSLTAIDLPECTYVSNNIFTNCTALESVSLPKCTGLGSGVFSGCNNLKTLTIGTEFEGVSMVFEPLPESIEKIYVNPNMVENYKSDWFWGQYADKIFAVE